MKRRKLRPLKLTLWTGDGEPSTRFIHRGTSAEHSGGYSNTSTDTDECREMAYDSIAESVGEVQAHRSDIGSSILVEPSHHQIEAKALAKHWADIRSELLSAHTEEASMPQSSPCIMCSETAELRCKQCGPCAFYCNCCFQQQHSSINIFHIAERWKGDHFEFVASNFKKKLVGRPTHRCSESKETLLTCVDEYGFEHSIAFIHCDCEPLAVTLVRCHLWPATPHSPRLVFTWALLDWCEALMLECQVALRDFCNALYFFCPDPTSIVNRRDVYRSLIDSFEEYRYFKHELRHLKFISSDLDYGNTCPACYQASRKVYSLDALFGLPRKKSAGESIRSPLHGDLFFSNQTEVDKYVSYASSGLRDDSKTCNNFLAGNMLRSNSRFKALDETALFGSACRHEFPGIFFSLRHGERLSYAVYMVESLLQRSNNGDIYIMYDIACTLHKHLERNGRHDVLDKIRLCLPSFHSFGHKASCQVVYAPSRCEGIGQSDGEVMERMWSFLRGFGKMTKEMRPSHRVDVLAHALAYYGLKKKNKLGPVLAMRWKKYKMINDLAKEAFQKLLSSFEEGKSVNMATVQKWIQEQPQHVPEDRSTTSTMPQWKIQYFLLLHSLFQQRERLSTDGTVLLEVFREVTKLDKKLKEIESKNKIRSRWAATDPVYMEVKAQYTKEHIRQVAEAMWSASSRRLFLIQLKAKYADGQKIAKKLEVQIRSETTKIKSLIPPFNSCRAMDSQESKDVLLEEALDPSFLAILLQPNLMFHSKAQQELINACLIVERSSEEIVLLQEEMQNTLNYYLNILNKVDESLEKLSSQQPSLFSRGAISLLQQFRKTMDSKMKICENYFSPILLEQCVPTEVCCEDDDDETDYENDDDEVYI